MITEALLSNFRFELRSFAKLLTSIYSLTVAIAFLGYGSSGVENIASSLNFLGADSLAAKTISFYGAFRGLSGTPETWLWLITLGWVFISCILLVRTYSVDIPPMVNIAPHPTYGVVVCYCLYSDLFSPGHAGNSALIPILCALGWAPFKASETQGRANRFNNSLATFALMVLGLIVVPLYAILAFPLWFGQGSGLAAASNER